MTVSNGAPAPRLAAWAMFVDFDGTITDRDTFDVLVEHFAGPEVWAQTERGLDDGSATIRDVLQMQAGLVRGSYADVSALLRRDVRVDPGFAHFVGFCTGAGAQIAVVSSGIEPIIRERLEAAGVRDVTIFANGLDPDERGWKIVYRDESPNGTDKVALVREARTRGMKTIVIGDGRSDYSAAAAADFRFAKRGRPLERYLRERGVPFEAFSSFDDIRAKLTAGVLERRATPQTAE